MAPTMDVQDAAADVGVQTHHVCTSSARMLGELGQIRYGHAEFRLRTGGPHVAVVSAANAGVDADKDGMALEELRPGAEDVGVVDSYADAGAQGPGILSARREVRSVQDPVGGQVGEELAHPCDFAAGHTFKFDAFG